VFEITVDEKYCKGCHLCISECKRSVLDISDRRSKTGSFLPAASNIENCVGCLMCERICPDLAIMVKDVSNNEETN
jgi:2-oxoglutarate ferredoxin oxidoreductase subunit delta